MKKKLLSAMLCLTMVISLLAGCGDSGNKTGETTNGGKESESSANNQTGETADTAASVGEKAVVVAIKNEAETLDPTLNNYSNASSVMQNLFTGLYQYDDSGTLVEGCAKSNEVSEDGLVYTFHLREDLKWSDGSDLTADDFAYAWKRTLNPETGSPAGSGLYYLKNAEKYRNGECEAEEVGIEVVDEYTLVLTLENPTAYFLDLLGTSEYWPVKQEVVEGDTVWTKSADTYVSNGAFKMAEINDAESYVLVKNEYYVDADKVNFDKVTIVFIDSEDSALTAFNSGEVDILVNVGSQAITEYKDTDQYQAYDLIGLRYYDFNTENEYVSDARVRKALAYALDRDIINQNLVAGSPESAYAAVSPGIYWGNTQNEFRDEVGDQFSYNVELAKQFLAEAGYENGEGMGTLTLMIQNSQELKDVAQAMQSMWKENLGVTVEIVTWESSVYWDEHAAGNFDIAYDGWTGDYNDPSTILDCFSKARTYDESRWSGELADKYDSLYQQTKAETDNEKRMELFRQMEEILMDEMPILPLYYRNTILITKSNITNVYKNTTGHTVLRYGDIAD